MPVRSLPPRVRATYWGASRARRARPAAVARWPARSARTLRQPVVDRLRHFLLRATRYVDADVAATERQLGVVVAADEFLQRLRRPRRHQMVLLSEDVEHRHLDHPQMHVLVADGDPSIDETVGL